jgi:hypothetical protein
VLSSKVVPLCIGLNSRTLSLRLKHCHKKEPDLLALVSCNFSFLFFFFFFFQTSNIYRLGLKCNERERERERERSLTTIRCLRNVLNENENAYM